MARPVADGRMINRSISDSEGFASLSPEAAVLFSMLIPWYNAHGKLNGGPGFIKDEVCPKVSYLTYEKIPALLSEITQKTNVKWFSHGGRHWLHSLHFNSEHQRLDKRGEDKLPSYQESSTGLVNDKSGTSKELTQGKSGTSPDQVVHEREREREVEMEAEGESEGNQNHLPVDNSSKHTQGPALSKTENLKPKETRPPAIPKAFGNGNGKYHDQESFCNDLRKTFQEICLCYPDFKVHRQVQLFMETNLKTGHRGAIIHTLKSLIDPAEPIKNVGGWLSSVFKIEQGKYSARDHEAEAAEWKKPLEPATLKILQDLGLSGFGEGL